MNFKNTTSLLTILFLLLFAPFWVKSQVTEETPMLKAIRFFDNGNYAEAEPLFSTILEKTPDDFMTNYFYGACRTENNHYTNPDLDALIKANQEVSPVAINYYFGIQYHARSNWERALKFYNKYKSTASLTEIEKQIILEKIQQCFDKINPYKKYVIEENHQEIIPVISNTESSETIVIAESENSIENTGFENKKNTTSVSHKLENEVFENEEIDFQINSKITYVLLSQFKTDEGKILFQEGTLKEKELENSLINVEELREKYKNSISTEEKKLIGQDILSIENNSYSLKKEAAQLLFQAKSKEVVFWENASFEEIDSFQMEIIQINNFKKEKLNTEVEFDSSVFINPNILLGTTELISSKEETVENELIYKIQIGAYSRALPNYVQKLFNKLSLIRKIENYTDDRGVVVYTTGNMNNYDDAQLMKSQVLQEGAEDALVVPYFKGKRITLKEAKELEAEK